MLGEQQEVGQPLLVSDAKRLKDDEPANAKVAIGDVLDQKLLLTLMKGQDVGVNKPGSEGDKPSFL